MLVATLFSVYVLVFVRLVALICRSCFQIFFSFSILIMLLTIMFLLFVDIYVLEKLLMHMEILQAINVGGGFRLFATVSSSKHDFCHTAEGLCVLSNFFLLLK